MAEPPPLSMHFCLEIVPCYYFCVLLLVTKCRRALTMPQKAEHPCFLKSESGYYSYIRQSNTAKNRLLPIVETTKKDSQGGYANLYVIPNREHFGYRTAVGIAPCSYSVTCQVTRYSSFCCDRTVPWMAFRNTVFKAVIHYPCSNSYTMGDDCSVTSIIRCPTWSYGMKTLSPLTFQQGNMPSANVETAVMFLTMHRSSCTHKLFRYN